MRTGNGSYSIESHDDDTVTLTVGTITARISGASWHEANDAATKLAVLVCGREELRLLLRRTTFLSQTVGELERLSRLAEDALRDLTGDLTSQRRGEVKP